MLTPSCAPVSKQKTRELVIRDLVTRGLCNVVKVGYPCGPIVKHLSSVSRIREDGVGAL